MGNFDAWFSGCTMGFLAGLIVSAVVSMSTEDPMPPTEVQVDTVEVPGPVRAEAFDMVCYFTSEEES